MFNTKSSTLNISLNRNNQKQQDQTKLYKQQQEQIEQQQQLYHLMANNQFNGHQSATHFLASLLQNPTVLQSPELMSSVASMLQNSLNNQQVVPIAQQASLINSLPETGNCFRNFSIPNSDTSSQLRSIINSSCNGSNSNSCSHSIHSGVSGDRSSQRSPSSNSSNSRDKEFNDKNSERFSASSSDNESHDHIDIGKFANSSELVINKVMTVIEEILHNDNIRKNNFLAKLFEDKPNNVRPEILVKRVAGFKRVKAITTEFKVVQAAMGVSKMFDLAADGLSAFRTMDLPNLGPKVSLQHNKEAKDQRVVKKILVINFEPEEFSIEKITYNFEKIGEIAQIILIRPNKKIPEFLSEYSQWVPDLGVKPCAIIDFENQEAAQNACREINLANRGGSGIRCALLKPGARIKRTLYRKYNSSNENTVCSSVATNDTRIASKNTLDGVSNFGSRENSLDSGINHNNDFEPIKPINKQQEHFNRKNVKKAISKHFISLGAWKNSSGESVFVNDAAQVSGFIRQPKGPTTVGQGFGLRRSVVV